MSITQSVTTIFKSKDETSKNFNRMGKNAKKFGETSSRAFKKASRSATSFGTITKGILAAGAIQRGIGIAARGISSITSEFIKFDDSIIGAAARFKDIGPGAKDFENQLNKIKKAAKEAGETTEFTASQSAEALNFLAKAGFNSTDAIGALGSMINLATATGEDFTRVADISSDLLGAFGLSADNSAQKIKNLNRLNDVLVKTTNSANVTVETMFETMKQVGPVATGILGASLEEVAALTGVLGDSGIKGSDAMTALKNAYLRLAAPVGAGATVLEEFGITLKNGEGGVKKITDVLDELGKAMTLRKVDPVDQAKALDAILGKRAIAGGKNLLNNIKNIKKFEKTLENSGGTAKKTADLLRQSLGNRLAKLNSAFVGVGFQMFEAFAVKGKDGITRLTELVGMIDLTPLINGIKFVSGAVSTLFNRVMNFGESSGIFAKVGEAIDALNPVFTTVIENFSSLFDFMKDIGVFEILGDVIGIVADSITILARVFVKFWDIARPIFSAIGKFVKFITQDLSIFTKFLGGKVSAFKDFLAPEGEVASGLEQHPFIARTPPNQTEIESRRQSTLNATLDITGAPEGSTFKSKSTGPDEIDIALLGGSFG